MPSEAQKRPPPSPIIAPVRGTEAVADPIAPEEPAAEVAKVDASVNNLPPLSPIKNEPPPPLANDNEGGFPPPDLPPLENNEEAGGGGGHNSEEVVTEGGEMAVGKGGG